VAGEISTFVSCAREVISSLVPVVLSAAGSADTVTKKRDGSLVTATDQLVESRVVAALSAVLPGIPILGEEGAIDSSASAQKTAHEFYNKFLSSPFQLIVDPIDGTRNFVDGRDEYCIAAALSHRVNQGIWPVAAVIALPKQGSLVWCDDRGAYREDLSSGSVLELKREPKASVAISVNSRDRAWLSAEGIALRFPWVSSGSSIYDFIGSAVGELQGSVVGSQRLWDLMAPLAVAGHLGMSLRDLKTGDVVTALCESDLSPDLVSRPWGLNRKMVLLPHERSIETLLQRRQS
jgi:fructose-1,6-bisphosphatase/inositol monophosphatase family enzyme